jgi:hypothetical protein
MLISGVLAIGVSGCNLVDDFRYYHAGIGSDLYVQESVTTTANLDAYLGLLCAQAGLQIRTVDGAVSCASDWSQIVLAGMNDIDGRCDAYLAWLDDKRRSNEPFLKQLAATSAATLGILDATSASVKAITITGIAFGLAANTFTNFNARILSLEQSTVQTVVIDSQQKYRQNNNASSVRSRAEAIYYLRNYLRICLPFTIETAVNNTSIVFHRAGPDALDSDTIFTRKMITDPNQRAPLPPRARRVEASDRLNVYEQGPEVTEDFIRQLQRTLCVSVDGRLGQRGSQTRTAIADFLAGRGSTADELLSSRRRGFFNAAIARFPTCPAGMTARKIGEAMKPAS